MTIPSTLPLERRLALRELRDLTSNGTAYLQVVIRVELSDLIENDMEWLNDTVNDQVLPEGWTAGLADLSYSVCGHEPEQTPLSWGGGSVLLHVSADASDVITEMLAESEEDEERQGDE